MVRDQKLDKAVVTARAVWKPTKYVGIFTRGGRFRVMAGRDYIGVYGSLSKAKEEMTNNGYGLEVDRTRREPISSFIAKAHTYLDWVVDTSFEPADFTNGIDIRKQYPLLVRVAPCTYQLHIEGKEKPWSRLLVQAYANLSEPEKMVLTLLTSDVRSEYMRAAAVQHRIYCAALKAASSRAFKAERKWWRQEVQHHVAQHMAWLAKAQSRGVIKKKQRTRGGGGKKATARDANRLTRGGGENAMKRTRGCGLALGQQGFRYRVVALSETIAEKYRDMAMLTAGLAAMPTPRNFHMYEANRQRLLAMPIRYHDTWYFRMFFEIERFVAFGTLDMPVGMTVTVEDFVAVFPDSVGHLHALARHFDTETVVTVMKRLGYTSRELPASLLTMHLCFLGQLHMLDPGSMRRVDECKLETATRKHANRKICGHPHKVWADACRAAA